MTVMHDLFRKYNTSDVFAGREEKIRSYIDQMSNDMIMGNDLSVLCDHVYEKFKIIPVELLDEDEGRRVFNQIKIDKQVTSNWTGEIKTISVDGAILKCYFPFRGSQFLFYCRGSTFEYALYPDIEIEDDSIVLEYQYELEALKSAEDLKEQFDDARACDLSDIRRGLNYVNNDVQIFDQKIKNQIQKWIEDKRKRVQVFYNAAKLIDVSVKKKEDGCCNISVMRRTIPLADSYTPQAVFYTISEANYNDIMGTIKHAASTMERTPFSYRSMEEEDYRNVLLVPLNAIYHGAAMGEAFRVKGKTDICIEEKNRAAFVAECKMWTGEKGVDAALEQLDGYLTWRDCKTALIFFVQRKDFLAILGKAKACLEANQSISRLQELDKNELRGFMDSSSTPGQRKEVRFLFVNMAIPEDKQSQRNGKARK